MFGLVTKRELDQLRADLVEDVRKGRALQEEMQYEWAKWFNKFRTLYAMLLKREKSSQDASGTTNDDEKEAPVPSRLAAMKRGMRGF